MRNSWAFKNGKVLASSYIWPSLLRRGTYGLACFLSRMKPYDLSYKVLLLWCVLFSSLSWEETSGIVGT